VRAEGSQATTDGAGRFTLLVRGRGFARVTLDRDAWLASHPAFAPQRGTYSCGDTWTQTIDLESGPAAVSASPALDVRSCPIE
jgi:hypothetical protein